MRRASLVFIALLCRYGPLLEPTRGVIEALAAVTQSGCGWSAWEAHHCGSTPQGTPQRSGYPEGTGALRGEDGQWPQAARSGGIAATLPLRRLPPASSGTRQPPHQGHRHHPAECGASPSNPPQSSLPTGHSASPNQFHCLLLFNISLLVQKVVVFFNSSFLFALCISLSLFLSLGMSIHLVPARGRATNGRDAPWRCKAVAPYDTTCCQQSIVEIASPCQSAISIRHLPPLLSIAAHILYIARFITDH